MCELRISLTKHADGGAILECVRDDGSITWQSHHGRNAAFFPLHDLTHFAVESVLGVGRAFYGLIAEGWDIEDTTGKGSRGALPPEALAVERLVGAFDLERAGSVTWAVTDLNHHCGGSGAEPGERLPRPVTDDELARIRERIGELLARWAALPVSDSLELSF